MMVIVVLSVSLDHLYNFAMDDPVSGDLRSSTCQRSTKIMGFFRIWLGEIDS